MIWNLPNTLTWLRIFAIPLVIVLFYLPFRWADPAAGLLFALAGITDSLDGYLARRMGQTSRLGAFLDPVADKLIVAVALVLLVSKEMPPIIVPGLEGLDGGCATLRPESVRVILVLSAIVIIGREIAISALARMDGRDRPARQGQGELDGQAQDHPADRGALLHVVPLEPAGHPGVFELPMFEIGLVLTIIAAILTLMSAISYLRAAWPDLKGHT